MISKIDLRTVNLLMELRHGSGASICQSAHMACSAARIVGSSWLKMLRLELTGAAAAAGKLMLRSLGQ